jgi:8-oxo-dGTP pyrophosphatase MutT (NUDIX family)
MLMMMLPMTHKGSKAAVAVATAADAAIIAATCNNSSSNIKRVVSCFLLSGGNTRETVQICLFHRVATMPTFANHWAAVSGSIEDGETPWQTACREVMEETNLTCGTTARVDRQHGLYVDVEMPQHTSSKIRNSTRIIRVYPFAARIQNEVQAKAEDDGTSLTTITTTTPLLELRGTEHDRYQWVSVHELEGAFGPVSVPSLARAFHHATFGRYLLNLNHLRQQQQPENDCNDDNNDKNNNPDETGRVVETSRHLALSPAIRTWASDHVNGASTMVTNAIDILIQIRNDESSSSSSSDNTSSDTATVIANAAQVLKMLRPTMVPITNILTLIETQQLSLENAVDALKMETARVVDLVVDTEVRPLIQQKCKDNLVQGKDDDDGNNKSPHRTTVFRIATFTLFYHFGHFKAIDIIRLQDAAAATSSSSKRW